MKIKTLIMALVCALLLGIGAYAIAGNNDLDLTNDPLISLSYLNEVFWPRIEEAIADAVDGFVPDRDNKDEDTEISDEDTKGNTDKDTSSETDEITGTETAPASFEYEVLHLIQGDIVLAETPCEIILRSGSAQAYLSGNESGIADLTTGVDILEGEELSPNHLLLVPRGGDGRGFIVTSAEVYIMVRGGYDIVTE
ncbi:MAG: hypothetical protein IJ391_03750 [Clostridia bacterium]|nr:hypothetical protein [Clostridia bacterium]